MKVEMAAGAKFGIGTGKTGAVIAIFFYGLILNILRSIDVNFTTTKLGKNKHPYRYFYIDRTDFDQTNIELTIRALTNFGSGKHVLAIIIYPQWYHWTRKYKSSTKIQQTNALLITICLLLSGDIPPR